MRYLVRRESSGSWAVFDVRRQSNFSQGLELDEARETADKMNRENSEIVNQFLDDNLLPK